MRITDKILDAFGLQTKALDASTWPADLLSVPTLAGVSVTPESALGVPSVSAAVLLIPGGIGMLPLALYREEGQGRVGATDHPAFTIMADAANDWTSSGDLRKQLAIDALLHGDGFALTNRLPSGEVFELIRAMAARAKRRRRMFRRPHRPRHHRSSAWNMRVRAGLTYEGGYAARA